MTLANDIRALRDRALADLIAAHDYYTDTKTAWAIVNRVVSTGQTFSARSMATGTVTTPVGLVDRARGYVTRQLVEATFQQFIAIFESYIFDLLRLWLTAFPQILMGRKVDFRTVLEAPDKDAITSLVVSKELNEILYERPTGWFAYLEDKAKLGCPSQEEIDRLAEAKASRDILAHNRGVASGAYASKAGKLARFKEGQRIEIAEPYHREVWELIHKVVSDISNAAIAKTE